MCKEQHGKMKTPEEFWSRKGVVESAESPEHDHLWLLDRGRVPGGPLINVLLGTFYAVSSSFLIFL